MKEHEFIALTIAAALAGVFATEHALAADWAVQPVINGATDGLYLNNLGQVAGRQGAYSSVDSGLAFFTGPDGVGKEDLIPPAGYTIEVQGINDAGKLLAVSTVDWADSPTAVAFVTADTLDSSDLSILAAATSTRAGGGIDRFGNAVLYGRQSSMALSLADTASGQITEIPGTQYDWSGVSGLPLRAGQGFLTATNYISRSYQASNVLSLRNYMGTTASTLQQFTVPIPGKGKVFNAETMNELGQTLLTSKAKASSMTALNSLLTAPPYKQSVLSVLAPKSPMELPDFNSMNNFGEVVGSGPTMSGLDGGVNTSTPWSLPTSLAGRTLSWLPIVNDRGQRLVQAGSPVQLLLLTPPPADCDVTYSVDRVEADRFWATLTITNLGQTPLVGWRAAVYYNEMARVTRRTNGTIRAGGGVVVALPTEFNRTIEPMGSTTVSFVGVKGTDLPEATNLVGRSDAGLCSVSIL
jgi:hypothetical protein